MPGARTQASTFRVERSTCMNAPPEKIFALVDDFRQWADWSPWEKVDPGMTRNLSGTPSGQGAVYEWAGKKVGAGRMEIVRSSPHSTIVIKLDFLKPFKAHNTAEFTLRPEGDATRVTWAMTGPKTLLTRVMGLFMSMDKMVGKDFEQGLANLKALAER